jgi:hypothetical protein
MVAFRLRPVLAMATTAVKINAVIASYKTKSLRRLRRCLSDLRLPVMGTIIAP